MDGSVGSGLGKGWIDLFSLIFTELIPRRVGQISSDSCVDFTSCCHRITLLNSTTTQWTSRKTSQTMLPSSELQAALKHVEAER